MRYVVSFLRFFSHTNICIGPTTEIHNVFANCVQCALEVSEHIYIINRKHVFAQKFTRKYCFNCFFTHWYQKVKYLMTCYIRCITFIWENYRFLLKINTNPSYIDRIIENIFYDKIFRQKYFFKLFRFILSAKWQIEQFILIWTKLQQ